MLIEPRQHPRYLIDQIPQILCVPPRKLATSEDRTAIGFDRVKRGEAILGGLVDTGVGFLGELAAKIK
jgi:hypothetical protein